MTETKIAQSEHCGYCFDMLLEELTNIPTEYDWSNLPLADAKMFSIQFFYIYISFIIYFIIYTKKNTFISIMVIINNDIYVLSTNCNI